jgi:hypothetical protein
MMQKSVIGKVLLQVLASRRGSIFLCRDRRYRRVSAVEQVLGWANSVRAATLQFFEAIEPI